MKKMATSVFCVLTKVKEQFSQHVNKKLLDLPQEESASLFFIQMCSGSIILT